MNERQSAFQVLSRVERGNAYSNLALDAQLKQDASDGASAFVTALVYGVIERKLTLDYFLSGFLRQPIKKLRPEVLTVLRMGVYQLHFMDKVPVSAAVNESVKLVKANGCSYAAGLVNSVLRKCTASEIQYPKTDDPVFDLSIRYSCPQALVSHYIADYGLENATQILSSAVGAAPITVRVNTLKTTAASLLAALEKEGIQVEEHAVENLLLLKNAGAPEKLAAYQQGLFHVQDAASVLCVQALDVQPGQTVVDVCSAPGGKAFTAAEMMENSGKLLAFDLHAHRVRLIESGAKRLGIQIIAAQVGDSSEHHAALDGIADRVLCDVPCSGLGTIRRKPEIRYRDLAFIDNLTELQYNILVHASKYLRENGCLVYSTCTLNRAENEAICTRFLQAHPDFESVDDYTTLLPHKDGTDGFFFARIRRKPLCQK